jgi:SAM-dependent methyltransferase
MSTTTCPACSAPGLQHFYDQSAVPVNSLLLLETAQEAKAFPTAPLSLAFCPSCGFVTNTAFDPAMTAYNSNYEETQGFSPRFRQFATDLAQGWVKRYDLAGRHVVEVGCGKGEFLAELVAAGVGSAVGYDPVYLPGRIPDAAAAHIDFVADFFGSEQAGIRADALVCRHTLEHIPNVEQFLSTVRTVLDGQPTVLLFEIPDVARILDEVAFWDVFYEHCSYFSAGSLARLFRRCGFEVLDLRREFGDQYLVIEARIASGSSEHRTFAIEDDLAHLTAAVQHFEHNITLTRNRWRSEIEQARAADGEVVLWGSGSKSVSFLTTTGIEDEIRYIVDINPNKQGTFNAGTGQQVVAPEHLKECQPALVIVMNPVYRQEIQNSLDELGVTTTLQAL